MRLVQISVPKGKRETILGVLEDEGIDYVVTEEASGREYTAVVFFPLPPRAVEPVMDELEAAGVPEDAFGAIIDAETATGRGLDKLEDRYASSKDVTERISRAEVRARASDLSPAWEAFVAMTVGSVVIATAGVLLDSAAVVVGSMVIAPLIGPAMATSVGTVLADRELFMKGVRLQAAGFVLGVIAAAVFAFLLQWFNLINVGPTELVAIGQIEERLAPDILSLVVALAAGAAGAYSLSSGFPSSLVGVAIAVALVPPTAVIGVGIAWGLPAVVIGSTVLVLVNFLSINLAALAVLWYQGYRPGAWFHEEAAREATIKRVAILVTAIAALSVFLVGATFFSYQSAVVEEEVRSDVREVLDRPEYDDLVLLSVEVERGGLPFAPEPQRVIVTVGHPPGGAPESLADVLAERIETGHDLVIEVRTSVVQVRTPRAA